MARCVAGVATVGRNTRRGDWDRSMVMTEDHRKDNIVGEGTDNESTGDATATSAGDEKRTPAEHAWSDPLRHVRRTETIADRVAFEAIRDELPGGWEIKPDIVQFGAAPLAETITFEQPGAGTGLLLKPVDDAEPAGEIEFYERSDPRAARRRTRTLDSLSAALRVAVNRVHQLARG